MPNETDFFLNLCAHRAIWYVTLYKGSKLLSKMLQVRGGCPVVRLWRESEGQSVHRRLRDPLSAGQVRGEDEGDSELTGKYMYMAALAGLQAAH